MTLKMLIRDVETIEINGSLDIEVSGVAYDSRKVSRGYIFIAFKGEHADGRDFIHDAVKRGAVTVVSESDIARNDDGISYIHVRDSRKALACISNNFYGRPSDKMTVIGVTGTNGKTTTTYIIKHILEVFGKEVGLIGTINYILKDRHYDAPHTTPEAPEFQSILSEMLAAGCSHVVTEVSSHALSQRRVDYTDFKSAVFTNLTRDHLDFHKTMEEYFKAKARLFYELLSGDGTAVVNFDDVWGRKIIEDMKTRALTYGIETGADLAASNIRDSFDGLTFDIKYKGGVYSGRSRLIGMHNVYNILAAAGAAVSLGIPWDAITEGISGMTSVKGRFEKVDAGQDFLCIIDYAHTEDALERLIYTARELMQRLKSSGKIITVFGCGGNRDRGKRPGMGAIATKLSDYVVITSDNPRNEDPIEIVKEIEAGVSRRNYVIEPERKEAVRAAVEIAEKGDILLVAGKGHEDYQEIKGIRHRFSDREALEDAILEKLKKMHDA